MMKTREEIITDMCYTWRHDYGLERQDTITVLSDALPAEERKYIWNKMSQIYDNVIEPNMSLNMFLDEGCAQRGCPMKEY